MTMALSLVRNCVPVVLWLACIPAAGPVSAQDSGWPDIRSVEPDLVVPPMEETLPVPGRRCRQSLEGYSVDQVYHALYLPVDWSDRRKYPVLVELAGNGGYRDARGDECTGRPEGCSLGYGISAGQGFIWLCLPYLNEAGDKLALTWWGDAPEYDSQPTLKYWRAAINDVCTRFGGDPDNVVLCGFSRGALACNYLALGDDETSRLWRAFVICSHYDGVRTWPYPRSDRSSAAARLSRLNGRPQFILGENDQTVETESYLRAYSLKNLTFASTGFQNHNDQWVLRPGPVRQQLRDWLQAVVTQESTE